MIKETEKKGKKIMTPTKTNTRINIQTYNHSKSRCQMPPKNKFNNRKDNMAPVEPRVPMTQDINISIQPKHKKMIFKITL